MHHTQAHKTTPQPQYIAGITLLHYNLSTITHLTTKTFLHLQSLPSITLHHSIALNTILPPHITHHHHTPHTTPPPSPPPKPPTPAPVRPHSLTLSHHHVEFVNKAIYITFLMPFRVIIPSRRTDTTV